MAFELLTGLLGTGASAYGQKRQINFAREIAQNAHQYETQDLIKAGINPIISGMNGASAPGIGGIDGSSIASAGNSAVANKIAKQELENKTKKTETDIQNETELTNAKVAEANANTARTLALTPQEVKTHEFNRSGRIKRELGEKATNQAIELIETAGDRTGTLAGNIENSANAVKTKAKKSWIKNVQKYNKEHENDDQPNKWKNYQPLKIRQHYD